MINKTYSEITEMWVLSKWPNLIDNDVEITNFGGDRWQIDR